ncbi:TPA: hypothetical protein ACOFTZ_000399, partial [Staphylococcus aureus]
TLKGLFFCEKIYGVLRFISFYTFYKL